MIGQKRFAHINELLNQKLEEKKTLIAVHRGAWGGNIIENTLPSFRISLEEGGDMFECDLSMSTDGDLYCFHDGYEQRLLGRSENIKTMSSAEIDDLIYMNSIGDVSCFHVTKFEEVPKTFCHGELYNIDRAWDYLPQVDAILQNYPDAIHQAVIKTHVKEEYLEFFQNCPRKYMYMPITRTMDDVRKALSYTDINLVGIEILAKKETDDLFLEENVRWIQEQGLFVWVNTLNLSGMERTLLYAHLDDDTAMLGNPDASWGVLLERGIDVIQTDWPGALCRYREKWMKNK